VQRELQNDQEVRQITSNVLKNPHETNMAIIRNLA
jgi:hypothetical protein